jgi:hypothetical protein
LKKKKINNNEKYKPKSPILFTIIAFIADLLAWIRVYQKFIRR